MLIVFMYLGKNHILPSLAGYKRRAFCFRYCLEMVSKEFPGPKTASVLLIFCQEARHLYHSYFKPMTLNPVDRKGTSNLLSVKGYIVCSVLPKY